MEHGARQQRKQLAKRRSPVVASREKEQPPQALASHPAQLHCPHCGHIIGDRDFARQHAPTVDWTGRASRYFRQPPIWARLTHARVPGACTSHIAPSGRAGVKSPKAPVRVRHCLVGGAPPWRRHAVCVHHDRHLAPRQSGLKQIPAVTGW